MFQAALTVHNIDADSVPGTTIITDDRSSCWLSDDDEVSECVCVWRVCMCVCASRPCVCMCVCLGVFQLMKVAGNMSIAL